MAIAAVLLVGITQIFALIRELNAVTESYKVFDALLYVGLRLPLNFYRILPLACILGGVMGLGAMAARGELMVFRLFGFGMARLALQVALIGLLYGVLATLMRAYVIPVTSEFAGVHKAYAMGGQSAVFTKTGLWLKADDDFIYVNKLNPGGELINVVWFVYGPNLELQGIKRADKAQIDGYQWTLFDLDVINILADSVTQEHFSKLVLEANLSQEIIDSLQLDADQMSIQELRTHISYQNTNDVSSVNHRVMLYRILLYPVYCLLMTLLALPFIFGPMRSTQGGLRLLSGIVLGYIFYIADNMLVPLLINLGVQAGLAVLAPLVLAAGVLALLFARLKYRT